MNTRYSDSRKPDAFESEHTPQTAILDARQEQTLAAPASSRNAIAFPRSPTLPISLFDPVAGPVLRPPPWKREARPSTSTTRSAYSATRKIWKRHERSNPKAPKEVSPMRSPRKTVKKIAFVEETEMGKGGKGRGRRGKVWAVPVISTPGKAGLRHKPLHTDITMRQLNLTNEDTMQELTKGREVDPEDDEQGERRQTVSKRRQNQEAGIQRACYTIPGDTHDAAWAQMNGQISLSPQEEASAQGIPSNLFMEALISPMKKQRRHRRRISEPVRKSRRSTAISGDVMKQIESIEETVHEFDKREISPLLDMTVPEMAIDSVPWREVQDTISKSHAEESSAPQLRQKDPIGGLELEVALPISEESSTTIGELHVILESKASDGLYLETGGVLEDCHLSILPLRLPDGNTSVAEVGVGKTDFACDTEMLMDFLDRAKVSKASRIAKRSSLTRKRDSNAVKLALSSPRKAFDDLDVNSPSSSKVLMDPMSFSASNEDLSTSPLKIHVDVEGTPSNDVPSEADLRPSQRRSIRIAIPKVSNAPTQISLYQVDGPDRIALKRSDAQELGLLTRTNTRRNKGGSLHPRIMVAKLKEFPLDEDEDNVLTDETNPRTRAVQWNDNTRVKEFNEQDTILVAVKTAESTQFAKIALPRRSNLKFLISILAVNTKPLPDSKMASVTSLPRPMAVGESQQTDSMKPVPRRGRIPITPHKAKELAVSAIPKSTQATAQAELIKEKENVVLSVKADASKKALLHNVRRSRVPRRAGAAS